MDPGHLKNCSLVVSQVSFQAGVCRKALSLSPGTLGGKVQYRGRLPSWFPTMSIDLRVRSLNSEFHQTQKTLKEHKLFKVGTW